MQKGVRAVRTLAVVLLVVSGPACQGTDRSQEIADHRADDEAGLDTEGRGKPLRTATDEVAERCAAISNDGITWLHDFAGTRPAVTGANEQWVLDAQDQTVDELLVEALEDRERWVAAHVVLSMRHSADYQVTMGPGEWNGLSFTTPRGGARSFPPDQMGTILEYWRSRLPVATEPVPRAGDSGNGTVASSEQAARQREIRAKLANRVSFEFIDTPLDKALQYLETLMRMPFKVAPEACENPEETLVTARISNMSLGRALESMLAPAGLRYTVRDQAVWVLGAQQERRSDEHLGDGR